MFSIRHIYVLCNLLSIPICFSLYLGIHGLAWLFEFHMIFVLLCVCLFCFGLFVLAWLEWVRDEKTDCLFFNFCVKKCETSSCFWPECVDAEDVHVLVDVILKEGEGFATCVGVGWFWFGPISSPLVVPHGCCVFLGGFVCLWACVFVVGHVGVKEMRCGLGCCC